MSLTAEIQVAARLLQLSKVCDLRCTTETSLHGLVTKGSDSFPQQCETSIFVWNSFGQYQGKDTEERKDRKLNINSPTEYIWSF